MLRFVGVIIDIKGDQDFLYTRESNLKLKMGVDRGGLGRVSLAHPQDQ